MLLLNLQAAGGQNDRGERQVVKLVMEYTDLSGTEVFVCNAALVEMYFLGTITQISNRAAAGAALKMHS